MRHVVIGLLAHVDAGKTTLSESLMYEAGKIRTFGRVDHRDAFLDFDNQERDRGITIFSKQAIFDFDNVNYTLIDTPGHIDFSLEMERTLGVLDYAVLVISGSEGVQSHTLTIWKLLEHYHIPTYIFVNKMDISYHNKLEIMKMLEDKLSNNIVDFSKDNKNLNDSLAMIDESMLNTYLESGNIEDDDISEVIINRKLFPCIFGSALKRDNVTHLMATMSKYIYDFEYPSEFGAKVYKITHEQGQRLTHMKITGGSLKVKSVIKDNEKVDQIRLYSGLKYTTTNEVAAGQICVVKGLKTILAGEGLGIEDNKLDTTLNPFMQYRMTFGDDVDMREMMRYLDEISSEDPGLKIKYNQSSRDVNVSLMGEIQIEVLKRIMLERYNVEVAFDEGEIAYRETLKEASVGIGHFEPLRHYAEVHVLLEPLTKGSGIVVVSVVSEDDLNKAFQSSILNAIHSKEHLGVLTASPITDLRITLIAGKGHLKHTEGGDFKEAAYRAIRHALKMGESILLEPYLEYRLEVPNNLISRAIFDIEQMKGTYENPIILDDMVILNGVAPASAMQGYQKELINYTKGMGRLTYSLKEYAPSNNQDEIVKKLAYDSETDMLNPTGSIFCDKGAGFYVPYYEVDKMAHVKLNYFEEETKSEANFNKYTISDEELKRVFERANPKKKNTELFKKPKNNIDYKSHKPTVIKPDYYMIDGYNVIYSDQELKALALDNLALARDRLCDLVANYCAYKKIKALIVYDAYRVKGNISNRLIKRNEIEIIYTKENETADAYIESHLNEISKTYQVTVVTSDYLEQIVSFSKGARRLSSSRFYNDMTSAMTSSIKEYENKRVKPLNRPLEYLKDEFEEDE